MRQIVRAARAHGVAIVIIGGTFLAAGGLAAHAGPSAGCAAVNRGDMNGEVEAGRSAAREIALAAGERLDISVQSSAGTNASVALVSGAGAPSTLSDGAGYARVGFTATQAGSYGFRFEAGQDGAARVDVTCAAAAAGAQPDAAFLARRADLLRAQEPDRIRIDRAAAPAAPPADQPAPGAMDTDAQGKPKRMAVSVSLADLAAAASPGRKREPSVIDFWLEGRYENYVAAAPDARPADGTLSVMYVGTKYMLGADTMVGALAQLDQAGEFASHSGTQLSASGWMAGPYVSTRLAPGIVFDGRAAWGQSENNVSAFGKEQADRRLVRGKVTGTRDVGPWKFAPSIGLSYLEDALASESADSARATAASGIGRVDVLPEVSRRFNMENDAFIEPRVTVGGFWAFDDLSKVNPATTAEGSPDLRIKAEAGVAFGVKDGTQLQATGGVESGGQTAEDNWMGRLQLNMPLNK